MGKKRGTVSGIYKIQSRIKPERVYIGSTANLSNRWGKHKRELLCNKHENGRLQNHVNKYGFDDLEFSLITGCGEDVLIAYEQFYIDALDPYFNICKTAGSTRGRIVSEETRKRSSESHKGQVAWNKGLPSHNKGRSMPEEQKEKIRQTKIGDKNPMFGKAQSVSANKKRSEALKNFYDSPEGIEWRRDQSQKMASNHPMLGKHHSEDALKKMRKPRSEEAKQNIRKAALTRNTSKNG